MKTTTALLVFVLASVFGDFVGHVVAQQTRHVKETPRSPEMDQLIKVIHLDLKRLKKTHPWLSEYDDKTLQSDRHIYYMRRLHSHDKSEMLPQQPSHISVTYCPIEANNDKGGKYYNDLEDIPACQFPMLKLKVYAEILVRGKENTKTAEAIRDCIVQQCEALHEKMDSRKAKAAIN